MLQRTYYHPDCTNTCILTLFLRLIARRLSLRMETLGQGSNHDANVCFSLSGTDDIKAVTQNTFRAFHHPFVVVMDQLRGFTGEHVCTLGEEMMM